MAAHYYDRLGRLVKPWVSGALPSPTTILSIIAKPELDEWRRKYDKEHGEGAADAYMRLAQERGTRVHKLCEDWLAGKALEFEHFEDIDYFIGFMNWCEKYQVEIIESELFLESGEYGYAGRCDLVVRIKGELWIIDIKTGAKRWAHGYQLRAYEQAYFEATGEHARMGVLGLCSSSDAKQCYHRVKETKTPLYLWLSLKLLFDDYMKAHPVEAPVDGSKIWKTT